MNFEAYEALRKSIAHWQDIVDGKPFRLGGRDCALCQRFVHHYCASCPVAQKTGEYGCTGTPFYAFVDWCESVLKQHPYQLLPEHDEGRRLAQAELDFLKSLLPVPDLFNEKRPKIKPIQDGDWCPKCRRGTAVWKQSTNCSCHISGPCWECSNAPLICTNCEEEFGKENQNEL